MARIGITLPLSGRQGGCGGEAESSWWPVHSRGLLCDHFEKWLGQDAVIGDHRDTLAPAHKYDRQVDRLYLFMRRLCNRESSSV